MSVGIPIMNLAEIETLKKCVELSQVSPAKLGAYVYIFQSSSPSYGQQFKIGFSINPQQRRKQLQKRYKFPVIISQLINVTMPPNDKPSYLEYILHKIFSDKCTYNPSWEWFRLEESDLKWLKKINYVDGKQLQQLVYQERLRHNLSRLSYVANLTSQKNETKYPHYCSNRDEAEWCADQIAFDNYFIRKRRIDDHNFVYENHNLIFKVQIFPDNWHRNISCYSFTGSVTRKDTDLAETLPYIQGKRKRYRRQSWRKRPSFFADDIYRTIQNLTAYDAEGRVRGRISYWNARKGYGFASCSIVPSIFVHIKSIEIKDREKITEGTCLKFKIVPNPEKKRPQAKNISVVDCVIET